MLWLCLVGVSGPIVAFLEVGNILTNTAFCISKVLLLPFLLPSFTSVFHLSLPFIIPGSSSKCSVVLHSWFLPPCWFLPPHSGVADRVSVPAAPRLHHCAVEPLNLIGAKHSLASCSHQWNCMSCCCKYLGSWCLKNAWVFHGFVESCRSSVQHSAQARTERVIVSHNTEITVFWAWHQPWNAQFSRALLST